MIYCLMKMAATTALEEMTLVMSSTKKWRHDAAASTKMWRCRAPRDRRLAKLARAWTLVVDADSDVGDRLDRGSDAAEEMVEDPREQEEEEEVEEVAYEADVEPRREPS